MKLKAALSQVLLAASCVAAAQAAQAAPVEQYANSVLGYSSQYSAGSWSAAQALGASNTASYGDITTAWAPLPINGSQEFLTLGFGTLVYSSGAVIRETYGNGFVTRIDALDNSNVLHTVWSGTDSSLPGSPVNFAVSWNTTSYLTKGLKIYVDTNHNSGAWEEIDSVKLLGQVTAPVPEPETYAMLMAGLGVLGAVARRKKQS